MQISSTEQLVVELHTADLKASCAFYRDFGFDVIREETDFVVLQWETPYCFWKKSEILRLRRRIP